MTGDHRRVCERSAPDIIEGVDRSLYSKRNEGLGVAGDAGVVFRLRRGLERFIAAATSLGDAVQAAKESM
jgi:hypothetical protein